MMRPSFAIFWFSVPILGTAKDTESAKLAWGAAGRRSWGGGDNPGQRGLPSTLQVGGP